MQRGLIWCVCPRRRRRAGRAQTSCGCTCATTTSRCACLRWRPCGRWRASPRPRRATTARSRPAAACSPASATRPTGARPPCTCIAPPPQVRLPGPSSPCRWPSAHVQQAPTLQTCHVVVSMPWHLPGVWWSRVDCFAYLCPKAGSTGHTNRLHSAAPAPLSTLRAPGAARAGAEQACRERSSAPEAPRRAGYAAFGKLRGFSDAGMSCAWSPSGACLATASQDGRCTIWDMRTRQVPLTLPQPGRDVPEDRLPA
jgi:hypothetical protein